MIGSVDSNSSVLSTSLLGEFNLEQRFKRAMCLLLGGFNLEQRGALAGWIQS